MKKLIIFAIVLVIAFIGYKLVMNNEDVIVDVPSINENMLVATLPSLALGHYEGWLIFGDEKVSTGKFDASPEVLIKADRDISLADAFVVTIETENDTDELPSSVIILRGDINDGDVVLSFPLDLSKISGSYILATPTNGEGNDELSGVWFLKVPAPLQAGLVLPDAPSGWVYEGWAVNGGKSLTTGRFTSVNGADEFNGFSGTLAEAPAYPGEDFITGAPNGLTFPIDLADGNSLIVISIEPDIDGIDPTGDEPFDIKPLIHNVPKDAEDHTNYNMNASPLALPSGILKIL